MRTDPTDNGGLFAGRRPGTAPLRFRALPERGSNARQRVDRTVANGIFSLMVLMSLMCWGPIPVGCLWIASRIDYVTGSIGLGILSAFVGLFTLLFGTLMILRRLDQMWILVRRAAGVDQRGGVLGRVFAVTVVICASAFSIWFILIHGPGQTTFSGGGGV